MEGRGWPKLKGNSRGEICQVALDQVVSKRLECTLDYREDLKKYLNKKYPQVVDYRILSQSLDARRSRSGRRPKIHYLLEVIGPGEVFRQERESFPHLGNLEQPPLIVGTGPAGLFAALRLSEYGIVSRLFERGAPAGERMLSIARHWRYGLLNPENNVCFGEGGAGLFSDGKLMTRIKSPYIHYIMNTLVSLGAPPEIAYLSNPHLGSNKIRFLIGKMSELLKERKCLFHYHTRVCKILSKEGKVVGVETHGGERFYSPLIILATGHSAGDIYQHLAQEGVAMEPKDFAVGIRIEHPRRLMNRLQYGPFAEDKNLETSRYRLSWENSHSRETKNIYSFCMCPGGYVLSSGTDREGLVTNGMSNFSRNSPWSNSALVVNVDRDKDFSTQDVLGGLTFQRKIERRAYRESRERASGREIPTQRVQDFMESRQSGKLPPSSCPSGTVSVALGDVLPPFVVENLRQALLAFNGRMPGFLSPEALCFAPETRTSAPVTILRDRRALESPTLEGLYPCGEGAGHAGGITSAAVDGVKVAMEILRREKQFTSFECSSEREEQEEQEEREK